MAKKKTPEDQPAENQPAAKTPAEKTPAEKKPIEPGDGEWYDRSGLIDPDGPDQRTHKQRMLDGDPFWGADKELLDDQARTAELVREYEEAAASGSWDALFEAARKLFPKADRCYIKPPFTVDYGYNTSFGSHTFVNVGAVFLDAAPITLGDWVLVGPNVQFLTAYHPLDPAERRTQRIHGKPIVVGDDAWIGGGSIILGGVTIGEAAVVGAGSVVTRDVPPRTIAVGNPAKVLREI